MAVAALRASAVFSNLEKALSLTLKERDVVEHLHTHKKGTPYILLAFSGVSNSLYRLLTSSSLPSFLRENRA